MRAKTAFAIMVLVGAAFVAVAYELGYVTEGGTATRTPSTPPPPEGTLRLHFVDVGQGDAVIWEFPDGTLALWDCGPPASSIDANPLTRYLLQTMGRARDAPIALLTASHGHLDHIGGCDEVFDAFTVERIADTHYEGTDAPASYLRFQEAARKEGAALISPRAGATLPLPGAPGVLWPQTNATRWDTIANHGIVARIAWGTTSACFQGDIEAAQERALAEAAPVGFGCDVVLMGHHGSRHASTTPWLDAMSPKLVVASHALENAYGHPHPEAVCRVQQAGARVLSTATLGSIVIELDGTRAIAHPDGAARPDAC